MMARGAHRSQYNTGPWSPLSVAGSVNKNAFQYHRSADERDGISAGTRLAAGGLSSLGFVGVDAGP